jgi:hypothetical protein
MSSVSQYVQLIRCYDQANQWLSCVNLSTPYLLLNLKYPIYLDSLSVVPFLFSIIEYTRALSKALDLKIVVSSHRLFDAKLLLPVVERLRSCDAFFDDRPIIELYKSSSYRALVSLPSGVIADSLALAQSVPISLVDPRSQIDNPIALARISAYIEMLYSFAPHTVSVIPF